MSVTLSAKLVTDHSDTVESQHTWAQRWSRQILLPQVGVQGQIRLAQCLVWVGGGEGLEILSTYLKNCGIEHIETIPEAQKLNDPAPLRPVGPSDAGSRVIGVVGTPSEVWEVLNSGLAETDYVVWAVVLANGWRRGTDWTWDDSPQLPGYFTPDAAGTLSAATWVATRLLLYLCGAFNYQVVPH